MNKDLANKKLLQTHFLETKDMAGAKIKSLEEQLELLNQKLTEAREEATRALKLKSEFLSSVSHEIRTPLNAVLGFSQWLYDNTYDEQHREYLSSILLSAKNLLKLLNDILDFSKIESDKIQINNNTIRLRDVINDIKLVFHQKAEKKGLELKISTAPSVPDCILIDEIRLYQIIFNLVSNAIKFTNSGYIHISSHAEQTANENEINLIISIEDTGIGIKHDEKETIFENFTRETREKYTEESGTGLGLAIVKGLVKKMNGTIKIDSKPGSGTNITVSFQKVKVDYCENIRKENQKKNESLILAPCKIMIVDDISYNILVLKQLIGNKNVTFTEASDGTNALAKLKTEKPDLIFMDIRMPGINGFDATELIKQDKELNNIPVIAFTGSTIRDDNSKIYSLFDGFLQKPVFKKDLITVLKRFLKYTLIINTPAHKTQLQKTPEISIKCIGAIPLLLEKIQTDLMPEWEKFKKTLIISEIENFKNIVYLLANEQSCNSILLQYHKILESGLKSFDIELIKKTLDQFPEFIKTIECQYQKMIH